MLVVIYEMRLGKRPDYDCRNPRAVSPNPVSGRWRYVVPAAAMFVVCNDNEGLVPVVTVLNGTHYVRNVLLALQKIGIPWVLVVGTERFDEADCGKVTILQVEEEVIFILEMRGGHWVALTIFPGSIIVEEGKGLMVPLEKRIHRRVWWSRPIVRWVGWRTRQCVIPAARIPLPTYAFGA